MVYEFYFTAPLGIQMKDIDCNNALCASFLFQLIRCYVTNLAKKSKINNSKN